MSKWVKQAGVAVEIREPRPRVVICDYGVEHRGDTCRCAEDEPDVPNPGKPSGYVTIRHGRRKPARVSDNKKGVAFAMTREEARKNGIKVPPKRRKKPPPMNKPMWEMTRDERARHGQRMRNL
jgi:hypothetical protein